MQLVMLSAGGRNAAVEYAERFAENGIEISVLSDLTD